MEIDFVAGSPPRVPGRMPSMCPVTHAAKDVFRKIYVTSVLYGVARHQARLVAPAHTVTSVMTITA